MSVEPADTSATYLGKQVSELQSDVIMDSDEIMGTLHYIENWTAFSSDERFNTGNFVALKFTPADGITYDDIKVGVVGGTPMVKLDSDYVWIGRVKPNSKIKVTVKGDEANVFTVANCVFETE